MKLAYDVLVMGRMDLEHALDDVDKFFQGIEAEMFMNGLEGQEYNVIVITLDNKGHVHFLEGGGSDA